MTKKELWRDAIHQAVVVVELNSDTPVELCEGISFMMDCLEEELEDLKEDLSPEERCQLAGEKGEGQSDTSG